MHTYRRDIDGLRALAIIPVVLFHFDVPGFEGGFTGVDVFFVISGFLIFSVINREMEAARFSFRTFYERRARRLFPALYVVLLACCVPAATLLLPSDFKAFTDALAAASVFCANVFLWRTTGYFGGPADHQPLLHMWSLAVEEQFYLAFPVALILARRFGGTLGVRTAILGTCVASLGAAAWFAPGHGTAVFYLPMFRAWELCLGALAAEGCSPANASPRLGEALSASGVALVLASALAASEGSSTPLPVPLFACIGSTLVLYGGRLHQGVTARLLSTRWLVFIGLISYSVYLWHWPLWVFTHYVLVRHPSPFATVGLVIASMALGALSWRFVEQPFRRRDGIGTQPQVLMVSTVLTVVVAALGMTVVPMLGRSFPIDVTATAGVANEPFRFIECGNPRKLPETCRVGSGEPTVVVWSDSHGMALGDVIANSLGRADRSGIVMAKAACGPLMGVRRYDREDVECVSYNEAVGALISALPRVDTVVLASRWAINAVGTRFGEEPGLPKVISAEGLSGNAQAFSDGLERTLVFLRSRKVRVVILTQVPEVGWEVPSVLARVRAFSRPSPDAPSLAAYRDRQRLVTKTFRGLAQRFDFRVVDLEPRMCPGTSCRVQDDRGEPLYRDDDHLSAAGNRYLGALDLFGTDTGESHAP